MSRIVLPLVVGLFMFGLAWLWWWDRPRSSAVANRRRQKFQKLKARREWFAGKELFADRMSSTWGGSVLIALCFAALGTWCVALSLWGAWTALRR